jgi:hypothetical protein
MSVALDLIGSIVIASFVILIGLRLNQTISGSAEAANASQTVQESAIDIVRSIEYDFRKMGYGLPSANQTIVVDDSTHITFKYGDRDNPSNINTVEWYLGDTLKTFDNKKTRILYRRVNNGVPVGAQLGVTLFKLRYFDSDGNIIPYNTTPGQVASIETSLRVESLSRLQGQYNATDNRVEYDESYSKMGYATSFWQQKKLTARNLSRHG